MSLKIKESSTCVEKHNCIAIAGFITFSWAVLLGPVAHAKFGHGVDRQNPDPQRRHWKSIAASARLRENRIDQHSLCGRSS